MSLLGGYRKKPGGDGYESLQLVESGAEGGGGGPGAVGAGGRSPARQQQQQHRADGSPMDSSGKGRAWGQWQRGQWQRFVLPAAASPHTTTITLPAAVGWVREP